MGTHTAVLVAVDGAAYHFDKAFSYQALPGLLPGMRVIVPFGRGGALRRGIVLALEETDETAVLKPVFSVLDTAPVLDADALRLAAWIKEQAFCTLYEALRPMLPHGQDARTARTYRAAGELPAQTRAMLSEQETAVLALASRRPVRRERLLRQVGLPDDAVPESLVRRGFLLAEDTAARTDGASERVARLAVSKDQAAALCARKKALTPRQRAVVQALCGGGEATVHEVCYLAGVTPAVVKALEKKGVVSVFARRVFRLPQRVRQAGWQKPALSPAQRHAYETLAARYRAGAAAALLYGVTGSGKTLVFLRLIEDVLADGRGAIVLVPEISLTPQAVSRFFSWFGETVAVLHSGLSDGERMDEWQRVKEGKARVVVGTRSAVFAPVQNLGLIVLDEEQEYTYKSESAPRYHARDVARFRCAQSKALLLLASATPSCESAFAARRGRYTLVKLEERFGGRTLPRVEMADMKQELADGRESPLSRQLLQELSQNLARGEQSILLLNRRGYHTFASCPACGQVFTCPNCSLALTYHSANGRMMCHACGYSAPRPGACPACGERMLRFSGAGTQRAEEALAQAFPQARVLRMDTDTTAGRFAHERLFGAFGRGEYDILIGTQMVAKGLDFPNVTLVGVLSADQSLYANDYRAAERTFSLLAQVVGRAGRGRLSGRALIQTQTPENETLLLAAKQDYEGFYAREMAFRKTMLYPPFCDICLFGFTAGSEEAAAGAADAFFSLLRAQAPGSGLPLRVLGPSPAATVKINGRYRYQIIIKCKNDRHLRVFLAGLLAAYGKERHARGVAAFADMNPLGGF